MTTVRLAHFSDIHLTARRLGWRPRDVASKRATGWVNMHLLGRGQRFRHAPAVVAAMMAEIRQRPFDGIAFSGDATGMGFASEFAVAAGALDVADPSLPPAVAVPGNHDYYTLRAIRDGRFEEHFAPWQVGERIDGHPYPFARKVGHVWLIAVNSATANRWHWDASGAIGADQLARLQRLCERLDRGPRILVTHYPLRTAAGLVEQRVHRLRDHRTALTTAIECGISLWLHGHIHKPFVLPKSREIPFPIVCVGSSTQTHRWAYHDYTVEDSRVTAVRRGYRAAENHFDDDHRFEFDLPETR